MIDENNTVVGVISERDCLEAILDGTYHGQANGNVGDCLSTDIESISMNIDIIEVAKILIKN